MIKNAVKHTFGWMGLGRSISNAPSRTMPDKEQRSNEDILGGRLQYIFTDSASGAPITQETAIGVPAVMACVNILSSMIAKIPVYLYQDGPKVPNEITDHPAVRVVSKPVSPLHTPFELRQLMESGRQLGGNGYARVYRNGAGEPISLEWLKPCDVKPEMVRQNGERFVVYKIEGEKNQIFTRRDILHVKGFSTDGIEGKSPIRLLRESIGNSIAQTQAAGKLMKNGAKWGGILKILGSPKKETLDQIRDEVNANMAGVMNAGRIPVVGGEVDWIQTNGMTMSDAQFIESRRFELQEIARIYQIPSFLIGDSTSSTTWGSGIEQQTLGFLNFCLDSHLVCWENALNMTLLTTDEINQGYFFQFDRDQLINASMQVRASFYQIMRNIGVYSPNDVRAKLGETLISAEDGGDDYGKPLNANISATNQSTQSTTESDDTEEDDEQDQSE